MWLTQNFKMFGQPMLYLLNLLGISILLTFFFTHFKNIFWSSIATKSYNDYPQKTLSTWISLFHSRRWPKMIMLSESTCRLLDYACNTPSVKQLIYLLLNLKRIYITKLIEYLWTSKIFSKFRIFFNPRLNFFFHLKRLCYCALKFCQGRYKSSPKITNQQVPWPSFFSIK